jgi:hypothetical protein
MNKKVFSSVFILTFLSLPASTSYGQSAHPAYRLTKIMGGTSDDSAYGIAADSLGNIYVTGQFQGSVNFGLDFGITDSKTLARGSDVFITRLALNELDITAPRHAVGDFDGDGTDEVAVDFGGAGIWKYDAGAWTQLAPENPESLQSADIDGDSADEILADLGTAGLWLWNGGTWSRLSGVNADHVTAGKMIGGRYLLCDFGASGLWAWTELGGLDAVYMIRADVNGDGKDGIAVDFGSIDLWLWNEGA